MFLFYIIHFSLWDENFFLFLELFKLVSLFILLWITREPTLEARCQIIDHHP